MENNEQQIKNKQMIFSFVGIAILIIGLVGVTYAFFNYTRTGSANTIRTGRIAFNAEQGDTVTLSDLFPISASGTITPETPGVGSVVVHITGDTEYTDGIEYIVKAVNVTNTSGSAALPISISIGYEPAAGNGKTIGTADNNYYVNRGGSSSIYKVLSTNTIAEDQGLVVGYIAPGETGIDGNLTVMAYLDASNIAITDTTPEATYYERNASMTADELSACASLIATGYTGSETAAAFCAGTGTRDGKTFQESLDEGLLTSLISDLLSANVITELYTDGTDSTWINGREVFTTEEWNALQSSGVSFQIKVEANEGVWVTGQPTLTLSSNTIQVSGTATITSDSNGTITCQSSDDTKATCTVSGTTVTVTGVAAGDATITVNQTAGTNMAAVTNKQFEVTVE